METNRVTREGGSAAAAAAARGKGRMTIKVAYIQNRTIQYRFKNTGKSRDNTLHPVHCQACAEKRAPGSGYASVGK